MVRVGKYKSAMTLYTRSMKVVPYRIELFYGGMTGRTVAQSVSA